MAATKKSTGAAAAPKKAAGSSMSYKDMIKGAITQLKERNGSSRQALKKYIQGNYKPTLSGAQFDSAFNKAIKAGVEKGDFTQPKGPSGPVKLAKKEPAEKKAAKPAAKTGEKKAAAPKKAAAKPKAAGTTAKKPAVKKAATGTKKTTTKKANTGAKRKTPTAAPAVVDAPTVLSKTKSGRVSKTKAPAPGSTAAKRSAAGKKGAAKSPATKKAAAKTES